MTDPPDSIDDPEAVEAFLRSYATGAQMAAYYVKLDHVKEAFASYNPTPEILRTGQIDWIDDLDSLDPSES